MFYEYWTIVVRTIYDLCIPAALVYLGLMLYTAQWKATNRTWVNLFLPARNKPKRVLMNRLMFNVSISIVFMWLAEYTEVIDYADFMIGVWWAFMVAIAEGGINEVWRYEREHHRFWH